MTRPPSIDVVVCTYNNAPLLDLALGALCAQRASPDVDWRILVVDNNCTDATQAVIKRHARAAPVPLATVPEPVQGLTPARLRGVLSTSGEWIAFVDDDCLLPEDWIQSAAEFALAHPECGAFGGRVTLDWEEPPPEFVRRYGWALAEQKRGSKPRRVRGLAGAGLVIRRAALVECGWVDRQFLEDRVGDKLVSGGDIELTLRLGAEHELWYNPACRLRHWIPARRTSLGYLVRITYGLGSSKLLGDSMLWAGSYPRWLLTSLLTSRRWAGPALRFGARALVGGGGGEDALIHLSILCGWLAGCWRLLTMDRATRQALLGCATA